MSRCVYISFQSIMMTLVTCVAGVFGNKRDVNIEVMLLALLAFNMASMLRNEFEDALGGCWDLHRFQQSVLRAGGRVVKHARRLWLHLDQSVRSFWQRITKRIAQLRLSPRWTPPKGTRHRAYVPPPPHAHLVLVLRD